MELFQQNEDLTPFFFKSPLRTPRYSERLCAGRAKTVHLAVYLIPLLNKMK